MLGKKDKHLAAAQKLLERGQLEKALAEFAKVVEEDPKDTRVWLKMAEVQTKRGANEEAATVYLKTGDLYIEQGFAQKAVAVYKNVVKLTPSAVDAYLKLGSLYKQLGLMNDSGQQYEVAATLYQRLGKLKEAINAFRMVVDVLPESLAAHIKLAELSAQGGLAEEAGRAFGRAADLLKAAGRHDEYLRVIERLLHHQPDNFARSREAAELYLARNNGRGALPKLQACLKVDPRDPTTLSMLAQAYEQLENKPKAITVLKDLVRLSHELGRTTERDAALMRALGLEPQEPELLELAGLYRLPGIPSATAAPRRPMPGVTSSGFMRHVETKVGIQSGSLMAGIAIPPPSAGTASTQAPLPVRDAARLFAETEVFAKYGLLDRAEQHARRLLAANPQHAEGRALLARILDEAGRGEGEEADQQGNDPSALSPQVLSPQALAKIRRSDADDDGVPLPLDAAAGHVRPLLLASDDDDAEPLDLTDAEELDDADLEEMLDGDAEMGETPPPVELGAFVDGDDLVEHTQAVVPLVRPVRSGSVDLHLGDDLSGRFDTEPGFDAEAGPSARRSLDAVELPPTPAPTPPPTPGPTSLLTPPPTPGPTPLPNLANLANLANLPNPANPANPLLTPGPTPLPTPLPTARDLNQRLDLDDSSQGITLPRVRAASVSSPLGAVPVNPEVGRRRGSSGGRSSGGALGSGPIGSPMTPPPRVAEPVRPLVPLTAAELNQHADLGIAYKEMGLLEQAMAEFEMVESEPTRAVFAMTMTAECLEAAGRPSEAAALYKRALNSSAVTPTETVVLYYGLGRAFEGLGDLSEARYFFEKVARRDPRFRDVTARLQNLQRGPEKQAK